MREVSAEPLLCLAPVHDESILQQVAETSCISVHSQFVLLLIIFFLLDSSMPWWLLTLQSLL